MTVDRAGKIKESGIVKYTKASHSETSFSSLTIRFMKIAVLELLGKE